MFFRLALSALLSVLLTPFPGQAQTDLVPSPKTAPPKMSPQTDPWGGPSAACTYKGATEPSFRHVKPQPQILSPVAHLDQINAIAFIPDFNYVVTASGDGTIRVWDSDTSNQIESLFSDYTRNILDVASRPSHATQIVASIADSSGFFKSSVIAFDLITGMSRPICSATRVTQLKYSPDGSMLAVLDSQGVSIWNADTFKLLNRINGPSKWIQYLDNETLATFTGNSVVFVDAKLGAERMSPVPTGVGTAFLLDVNDGVLFHLNKNILTVWSLATAKLVNSVTLFSSVQYLAFDQDQGKLYASGFESFGFGGKANFVYRISGADWKNMEVFGGPDDRITALALAHGHLMVGEFRGQVRRFDARKNFEVGPDLGVRAEDITSIATSAGDHYIAAGDRSGVISVWETDSGAFREIDHFKVRKDLEPFFPAGLGTRGVRETFTVGEPKPPPFLRVLTMTFVGNSTMLAIAYGSGHTLVIDVLSGKIAVDASISDAGLTNFVSIGGTKLFIGSDQSIHWWDIAAGTSGALTTIVQNLSSLCLTSDGNTLVVVGGDGLQAFDTRTNLSINAVVRRGLSGPIVVADDNQSVSVIAVNQLVTWQFSAKSTSTVTLDRGIPAGVGPDLREETAFYVSSSRKRAALIGYGIHIWESANPSVLRRIESGFSVTAVALSSNGKTVIAGGRDGTIGFFDLASGRELGGILWISSLGWYGRTTDGLFDASPLLWDRLSFSRSGLGLATLSSSDMFNQYFTPNVIPRTLLQIPPAPGSQVPPAGNSHNPPPVRSVPPSLRIISPLPTITIGHGVLQELTAIRPGNGGPPISIVYHRPQPEGSLVESGLRIADQKLVISMQVTDRGGGLSTCKLFRNSHLIHSFVEFPRAPQASVTLTWEAEMLPGSVEFSAYCFDKFGSRSNVVRSTVVGDDKLKGKRTAYIIGVGIGNYRRPNLHLDYAASDVELMTDALKSSLSNGGKFDDIIPIKLRDAEATSTNILASLELLAGTFRGDRTVLPNQIRGLSAANANDTVFFYFSGHGTKSGLRYLLLASNFQRDLASGGAQGTVSDLELANVLQSIDASQIIVVLDACESGAALDTPQRSVGPFNFKSLAQMAYDKGIFVISATQSNSDAHESSDLCHAQFTYILAADGLVSYLADWRPTDGVITTTEWLQYGAEHLYPQIPIKPCSIGAKTRDNAVFAAARTPRKIWEQVPRLFLPDVYSGFDFPISDINKGNMH